MDLVVLLLLAKVIGYMLKIKGLHPIVGHVIAGLVLGPYVLKVVYPSIELETIASVSLLLLLFYTGLTTNFRELRRRGKAIVTMGLSGVAATFAVTYMLLYIIGVKGLPAVFIAVALSNTATETVAAAVAYAGGRDIRTLIVGASFVDDVIAAFVISVVASLAIGKTNIVHVSIATVAFMFAVFILSHLLATKFTIVYRAMSRDYFTFASFSLMIAFSFALIAYMLGLSVLIGAYLAGLLIGRGREFHDPLIKTKVVLSEFIEDLSSFLEVLFIPMFFAYIGLLISVNQVSIQLFATALIAAILGKIIGCTPIAISSLKDKRKGFAAGVAMTGRGALETALLKLGLDSGIINVSQYSTIILVALATAVLAPLLYSIVYRE